MTAQSTHDCRLTDQLLPPLALPSSCTSGYQLYPSSTVSEGSIGARFVAIAEHLAGEAVIRIDGFSGVYWEPFRCQLKEAFKRLGIESTWVDVTEALREPAAIESMVEPFLGGDDPLFGKQFIGTLADFFDLQQLAELETSARGECTVYFGYGAALLQCPGPLVYVDLPKNEVQFRSRAGALHNLGTNTTIDAKAQYKRFYFVDWPVLNAHKGALVDQIDWFIDSQRPEEPTIIAGDELRDALDRLSHGVFRVRPWFEMGPWGGQWIKNHIPELPQEVPNYAWSFELIVPENGLMFSDGKHLLEVSFDWLMYRNAQAVLGDSFERFGHAFPIRFNFLDTFDGGNLSVQCHPRNDYIREHFGEPFTQDETYYILDCLPGSEVYLGFVEGVDPQEFREQLETSFRDSTEIDVKRYVNTEPTYKHDLFLIPGGTIHCSGVNNLVLEISATTYIFTFKMYDWLRMDLDGQPRPLNIDRAMDNLDFQRQGDRVAEEFVSHPVEISSGEDWRLDHLPTHREHFYDVHRWEFESEVTGSTDGSPQVMALVEGSRVIVETEQMRQQFNYVETFVIPAAAGKYKLINPDGGRAMVVKAFMKPSCDRHRKG